MCAVRLRNFVEKTLGCCLVSLGSKEKINRLAFLVHCTIEVFPGTFDLDISLVHPPASTDRALALSEHLFQLRQQSDRRAPNGWMINEYTTLRHHFFDISIA